MCYELAMLGDYKYKKILVEFRPLIGSHPVVLAGSGDLGPFESVYIIKEMIKFKNLDFLKN